MWTDVTAQERAEPDHLGQEELLGTGRSLGEVLGALAAVLLEHALELAMKPRRLEQVRPQIPCPCAVREQQELER